MSDGFYDQEVDTQGFPATGDEAVVPLDFGNTNEVPSVEGDFAEFGGDPDDTAEAPAAEADPSEGFVTTEPDGTVTEGGTPESAVTPAGEGAADVATDPSAPRRMKGDLGLAVLSVTDEFAAGTWAPTDKEGEAVPLTPHRIASRLKDRDGLDKAPSTGAITNVLKAWAEIGFATNASDKPLTFGAYVAGHSAADLASCVNDAKAARRATKAAEKAAAAPVESVDPAGDVEPAAV